MTNIDTGTAPVSGSINKNNNVSLYRERTIRASTIRSNTSIRVYATANTRVLLVSWCPTHLDH